MLCLLAGAAGAGGAACCAVCGGVGGALRGVGGGAAFLGVEGGGGAAFLGVEGGGGALRGVAGAGAGAGRGRSSLVDGRVVTLRRSCSDGLDARFPIESLGSIPITWDG